MSVYTFLAQTDNDEHHMEAGSIIARDRLDAFDKLKKHQMKLVKLKKIKGLKAFVKAFTADIR